MHTKGLLSARRDNSRWLVQAFTEVLEMILLRASPIQALNVMFVAIERLLYGLVDPSDMAINKSMGSNYDEDCNATMKVFGDYLKEEGHPIQAGERLDYVVVDTGRKEPIGKRARLLDMYLEAENPEPLDFNHYLKLFQTNMDKILSIGYKHLWSQYGGQAQLPGYAHPRRSSPRSPHPSCTTSTHVTKASSTTRSARASCAT